MNGARIALACMTEPGDAVTNGLVGRVGAVEAVGLLDSHAVHQFHLGGQRLLHDRVCADP
jgi:hypothetical protein